MFFDYFATWLRVIKAYTQGTKKAVLANVTGIGDGLDETSGEQATQQPVYGQIGLVARPRPAVSSDDATGANPAGYAEMVGLKVGDGVVPIAGRDLRLNAKVNPAEGEVDVVHYGGGFLSLKDGDPGQGTTAVLYTPKQSSGGGVEGAHVLVMDTSTANLSVSLVHSDGHAVLLTREQKVVIKNAVGDAYIEVSASGITLNGNVTFNGGAIVGTPTAPPSLPVALATALNTYLTLLEAWAAAAEPAIQVPLATLPLPAQNAYNAARAARQAGFLTATWTATKLYAS